jgi:hypothetical protein
VPDLAEQYVTASLATKRALMNLVMNAHKRPVMH